VERLKAQLEAAKEPGAEEEAAKTASFGLEARLEQLTESLLQKQALLEAVSAEKTSLVLQLERAEVS